MKEDIFKLIRSGGYLPESELPADIFNRLSRAKLGMKIPQSPVGTRYLDNVFPHRFLARTEGCSSFDEAFYNDQYLSKIIGYIISTSREPDKDLIIRNLQFHVKVPAHFFPESSAALCNHFASNGFIYDPYIGWGGKSLGAICSNAKYLIGTDLQSKSVHSAIQMAQDFSDVSKTVCEFIYSDANLYLNQTSHRFDFIVASPPFLDTEDYGNGQNRTLRQWSSDIVIPLALKCKRVLNNHGIIAVHGQDRQNLPVLSLIYTAFICAGYSLKHEFKYGKKPGQSILIFDFVRNN